MTSITIHDGAESIGGNKIHVEEKGRGVFLDFGKNFAKSGAFFSEFLKERPGRGLNDAFFLDLVPKLNIYRKDLGTTDLPLTRFPSPSVEAVLISHAHVDHFGNIGLLNEKIPIIATPVSLAIMKGMQDTSPTVGSDTVYFSKKVPNDKKGLLLMTGKDSYRGRNFYCTGKPSDALHKFLALRPSGEKAHKSLVPGILSSYDQLNLPFEVRSYEVDHSIYGACAYLLTGQNTIAYTGDFRLHGKHGDKTRKFVDAAKEASVLICEGTTVTRKSACDAKGPVSEESVRETCRAAAESAKGLVIADFSPRNFERLESFLSIAGKTGRELVVTAKDLYLFLALSCTDMPCPNDRLKIYYELKDRKNAKWETEVVMKQCPDQYIDGAAIAKNPDKYILCFSFFDMKNLLDIKPDGGTYIYSSCEAFSEEMEFDFKRLAEWLKYFNFDVKGFGLCAEGDAITPVFDSAFHASGHASPDDITRAIDTIDPDIIIPVHTENPAWFAEKWEKTRIVHNGERVEF
ncbi:MAG: MBL fold metallo-hydrolase [Methanoregula sp.]|nr:MAG: MBL fold metallo-hydrolase [Methanoregula sp.]